MGNLTDIFVAWALFMVSLILVDVVLIWKDIRR